MSARIVSASAIPGVRSSSSCTPRGSMAIRAACRYSSRRCADTSAMTIVAIVSASTPAVRLLPRKLRTVVVGRIAIDRMDVIDAALRRVLDDESWSLDPEVCRASVRSRATPCEGRFGEMRPELGEPCVSIRVVHDARPLANEIEQHRLLRRRKRRRANAFGLYGSSILTGSQHEIGDTIAEDCLPALGIIQGVDQR